MTARIADPALEPPITLEDRDLIIPDELRIIGVAHDNWAEKVHFEFPTSFDENSWQGKLIYIDFMNAGGESDTQPILESTIEDGVLKFAWEIDNRFTRYNGTARFAVRITSSDGYRFGTKISAVEISEGIYVESEIDAEVTSRLEQWEARIAELIDDASTTSSKVNGLADSYTKNISQLTNTTSSANEAIAKAETAIDRATEAYNNTLKEPITEDNYLNGIRYTGEKFHGKCSRSGIEVMHITGKTEQERTNGYQLFDASRLLTGTKGGVTVEYNADGNFSVTGKNITGTSTEQFHLELTHDETLNLFKAGAVYNKNPTPNSSMMFRNVYRSSTKAREIPDGDSLTQSELDDPTGYMSFDYMPNGSSAGNSFYFSDSPMVYQDGDGTWEPFTGGKPGPNPDYPLPLKSFEATKVVVMGKNVAVFATGMYAKSCVYEQLEDGTFLMKVNGTDPFVGKVAYGSAGISYDKSMGVLVSIPENVDTVYTKAFDDNLREIYIQFFDKWKHALKYKNSSTGIIAIPSDAFYISLRVGSSRLVSGQTYTDRVMVSFEPITEWVPPHYEEIELPEPLILRSCATGEYDELLEDGTIKRNCKEITIDQNSSLFNVLTTNSGTCMRSYVKIEDTPASEYTPILSNRYISKERINVGDLEEGEIILRYDSGWDMPRAYYTLPLEVSSDATLKAWLTNHPFTIIYPLAVPEFETYPMPILPSWDDECRAFFVSETETEIEWRPCPIGDRSREIQKLEEKITDLEAEIVDLKTATTAEQENTNV